MTMTEQLLPGFDQEMAATRRVLERVPSEKAEWKPHPKSFALGHLAQLLPWMPGWIANTLTEPALDFEDAPGYSFETTETLLAGFEGNVAPARTAIEAATDEDYDVAWSLKNHGQVIFTVPRRVVVRQHISHLSHHGGQMTVYLRLLDIPVPSVYGPTADEGWG